VYNYIVDAPNFFIYSFAFLSMKKFHIGIVGGGVVGSAIARELSKYEVNTCVFEMGSDIGGGASKANSGVIHSGINSPSNSLKARFCVKGNDMFCSLANELGIPIKWVGKFVVAKDARDVEELERLRRVGEDNGVQGLEIVDKRVVKEKEPSIVCYSALWVPTAGILSPYEFTIALAESAAENDVTFLLDTKVIGLKKQKDTFVIETNRGEFYAEIVINASGVNCREIVTMLEEPDFQVYPCRGEYLVLDKNYRFLVNAMIYPVPMKEMGVLGVHITPTIEGNILLGPSAEFIDETYDVGTTQKMMQTLMKEARVIIPSLPMKGVISAYSGIRCKLAPPTHGGWADFRIEESRHTPGFINLLGIESPGLTAAPAIAQEVLGLVSHNVRLMKKDKFKAGKTRKKRFSDMSPKEQSAMIKKNDKWGRIVCRCETVTEAEVIEALSNPLATKTLSSVKYRCRAGMGRCQGGFCTPHIVRIMEKYFGMNNEDITLKSPASHLFCGKTREALR
jgi:glycerol-3-phosphate dehydrogenase